MNGDICIRSVAAIRATLLPGSSLLATYIGVPPTHVMPVALKSSTDRNDEWSESQNAKSIGISPRALAPSMNAIPRPRL